jgi:putative flippase GtrA
MFCMHFLRFIAVGGTAAALNLASRFFLSGFLPFSSAVVVAYLIGMVAAFLLARTFVFPHSNRDPASEFSRFIVVNVGALAIVWSVSVALAETIFPAMDLVWHAEDVAHFIGVASTTVSSYFAHKNWSFAQLRETQ